MLEPSPLFTEGAHLYGEDWVLQLTLIVGQKIFSRLITIVFLDHPPSLNAMEKLWGWMARDVYKNGTRFETGCSPQRYPVEIFRIPSCERSCWVCNIVFLKSLTRMVEIITFECIFSLIYSASYYFCLLVLNFCQILKIFFFYLENIFFYLENIFFYLENIVFILKIYILKKEWYFCIYYMS